MDDQEPTLELIDTAKMKQHLSHKSDHTLSITSAVFSVVSVTIGAGMVAVPKSAFESGIPWALGYYAWNYVLTVYSIHLFLRAAEISGHYSMPKLGYE